MILFAGEVQHKLPNITDSATANWRNNVRQGGSKLQSSFAIISCLVMGVKLSTSSPCAARTGAM